jgi:hypothetical protein
MVEAAGMFFEKRSAEIAHDQNGWSQACRNDVRYVNRQGWYTTRPSRTGQLTFPERNPAARRAGK